ncbi:MAG: NfeD family protein, partial [Nitrospiraceae bacterium]
LHIVEAEWFQWLLFSALSILSLITFRGPLRRLTQTADAGGPAVDTLIGKTGLAVEDIAPEAIGKVELHGTMWSARNAGTTVLIKGQRGQVFKVEGLTLWIKGE